MGCMVCELGIKRGQKILTDGITCMGCKQESRKVISLICLGTTPRPEGVLHQFRLIEDFVCECGNHIKYSTYPCSNMQTDGIQTDTSISVDNWPEKVEVKRRDER